MFCPECGEVLEEGAQFCSNCGAVLDTESMGGDVHSHSHREEKKTLAGVIIAVIAVLVLIGGGLAFFLMRQDSDKKDNKKTEAVQDDQSKQTDKKKDSKEEKAEKKEEEEEKQESKEKKETEKEEAAAEAEEQEAAEEPADEYDPKAATAFHTVTASSTLPGDTVTAYYGTDNAIDGKPDTAWNEGSSGDGTGEWIELSAKKAHIVHAIEILAGYPKGEDVYERNCRPKDVTVSFDDGPDESFHLQDQKGTFQRLEFEKPRKTKHIRITIDSVYPGTQYNDCCIAEITVE